MGRLVELRTPPNPNPHLFNPNPNPNHSNPNLNTFNPNYNPNRNPSPAGQLGALQSLALHGADLHAQDGIDPNPDLAYGQDGLNPDPRPCSGWVSPIPALI